MTHVEQARTYLAKCDPAISGQGGHNQTFSIACILVQEFGLSVGEAKPLMAEFSRRCQPPWSDRDINHKLRDAEKQAPPSEGRGFRAKKKGLKRVFNGSSTPAPVVAAVKKAAPELAPAKYQLNGTVELPSPMADGARELIKAAFLPNEGVRIAQAKFNEEGKEIPKDAGITLSREEWLKKLDSYNGDINRVLKTAERNGIYISINPMRLGGSRDSDVTSFRHTLVEWDSISKAEQWNIVTQSNVPCTAVIDSGGKSIHAWVKIDAKDRKEFDERIQILYKHFETSGCQLDEKNKNPSRLSRLAACERGKSRQELLAVNVGAASWTEWTKAKSADDLGPCHTIAAMFDVDISNDPNCVIGFRDGKSLRYLCKGKSAWLIGPSGVGKSSLVSEFAIAWALGVPAFGITPARPLKSLIIQAENDFYDLAEMAQGVIKAHGIDQFSDTFDRVNENVIFKTETTSTGIAFVDRMHRLIDRERPDVVWADPFLSFAGIDVTKQDTCSHFLRCLINPVLEATGVVLIGIHHTGKPKKEKEAQAQTALDHAYSGLGSSELVNWARAVLTLVPLAQDGQFRLALAKRGMRAGAKHLNGESTLNVFLEHAKTGIRWNQIETPFSEREKDKNRKEPKAEKLTLPAQIGAMNSHDFIAACKVDGEGFNEIVKRLEEWLATQKIDASKGTCQTAVKQHLIPNGKLEKRGTENGVKYFKGPNA